MVGARVEVVVDLCNSLVGTTIMRGMRGTIVEEPNTQFLGCYVHLDGDSASRWVWLLIEDFRVLSLPELVGELA